MLPRRTPTPRASRVNRSDRTRRRIASSVVHSSDCTAHLGLVGVLDPDVTLQAVRLDAGRARPGIGGRAPSCSVPPAGVASMTASRTTDVPEHQPYQVVVPQALAALCFIDTSTCRGSTRVRRSDRRPAVPPESRRAPGMSESAARALDPQLRHTGLQRRGLEAQAFCGAATPRIRHRAVEHPLDVLLLHVVESHAETRRGGGPFGNAVVRSYPWRRSCPARPNCAAHGRFRASRIPGELHVVLGDRLDSLPERLRQVLDEERDEDGDTWSLAQPWKVIGNTLSR